MPIGSKVTRELTAGLNWMRGVRHWQEYRRTSELKYGIYSNHISVYVRVFSYIVLIT